MKGNFLLLLYLKSMCISISGVHFLLLGSFSAKRKHRYLPKGEAQRSECTLLIHFCGTEEYSSSCIALKSDGRVGGSRRKYSISHCFLSQRWESTLHQTSLLIFVKLKKMKTNTETEILSTLQWKVIKTYLAQSSDICQIPHPRR